MFNETFSSLSSSAVKFHDIYMADLKIRAVTFDKTHLLYQTPRSGYFPWSVQYFKVAKRDVTAVKSLLLYRFGHFSAQLCFRPTLFGPPFSAQFWYKSGPKSAKMDWLVIKEWHTLNFDLSPKADGRIRLLRSNN